MSEHILSRVENSTLIISINRPEAKNALSLSMYQSLTQALKDYQQDDSLKSAIFYGSETCFTAGNDLKDFLSSGELNRDHPTVQFLYEIANCQKPLIAAVAGPAIGIGTTLLMHCDLVVAADNTVFQLPFSQLGVCPELASSLLLPKMVGYQQAFELLVLGERFDAQKALELGLINKVSDDNALDGALGYANKLAKLPASSVMASKSLIRSDVKQVNETIEKELAEFQRLLDGDEAQQVIANFFKR